jgi:hypothetical protein
VKYEEEIQALLAEWEKCLIQGYKNNYPLTFLSG